MFDLKSAALYALYGLPPCSLGFCGQRVKSTSVILNRFLKGEEKSLAKVRRVLEGFEAAYPYIRLIAQANSLTDPLDEKAIEAYWLGNSLLEKVKEADIKRLILEEFTRPGLLSAKEARKRADFVPKGAVPHHGFHVLILGSITGRVKFTDKIRDLCRIGWGKILQVKSPRQKLAHLGGQAKLKIKYNPLKSKNGRFYLAKPTERVIDWDPVFVPQVKVGEVVSFHWNRACQVLSQRQEENLEKYTLANIEAFNAQIKEAQRILSPL